MSRSKSPDAISDYLKLKERSQVNNSLVAPGNQGKGLKLSINSQGHRGNSLANLQASKKIHRKVSLQRIKTPLFKPHHSPISGITSSVSLKSTVNIEYIQKFEQYLKKIADLDKKNKICPDEIRNFSQKKLELHKSLFNEIIEKDKFYGKYLNIIKKYYENYCEEKVNTLNLEMQMQVNNLHTIIQKNNQDKASLERSLDKIFKENYDLCKDLEDIQAYSRQLEEKFEILKNFDIEKVPLNVETWKCLILENNYYTDLCKDLKNELRAYRSSQKVFQEKVSRLKKNGIDIGKIITEIGSSSRRAESNSDAEMLVSGRALFSLKPQNVPGLDLEDISVDSFTSSQSA